MHMPRHHTYVDATGTKHMQFDANPSAGMRVSVIQEKEFIVQRKEGMRDSDFEMKAA